ncbi:MAG: glutamyl-tRNA reductase [Actinomycetota bacterium]|nr:glutamyl-tRNA reductase [Actinomycetota bacterium]
MSELLALGLSHKTAPLELRERLALPEGRAAGLMTDLTGSGGAAEATIVSTCNRTEVYLVAPDPVVAESVILAALASQAGIRPTELVGHLYSLRGPDAARHLYRVTSGLDSMIIGEAEIQGQIKRAHELALVEGAAGPVLSRLFRGAIAAGGRARNETGISEKGVSVASVAVSEAKRTLGDLANRQALVIGAGDTAELVARALTTNGSESVFIANRHFDRAQGLADRFGGEAARVADLPDRLADPDIVVSATNSPHHLLDSEILEPVMESRGGRPLLLIDLAVPRDIDPGVRELAGVTVVDIDDLQVVIERNAASRASEGLKAERILAAELELFERWLDSLEVLPAIVALRERADEIVRRVLAENEDRWMNLSDADRERAETVARTVAQRMLHEPTLKLKELAGTEAAYEVTSTLRELFGLNAETDPGGGGEASVTPIRREV